MTWPEHQVRSLTEAEREQLRKRRRGAGRRLVWEPLFWLVFSVALLGFGFPAMVADQSQSLPARVLFIAAFLFVYAIVTSSLPAAWRETRAERRKLREALDENRVEVTRYQAHGAISLVDEHPGWIFDLGGGQLLYLRGIDAYPDNAKGEDGWPCSRFETAWIPGAGIWLGTEALGPGLSSVPLVDPSELDPEVSSGLETPAAGSDAVQRVLTGRLEDLLPASLQDSYDAIHRREPTSGAVRQRNRRSTKKSAESHS